MLAAVGGLAYLLSTILKLEGSLGYFLPLPVVLAAMRGGPAAGAKTMMATGFLLVGETLAGRVLAERAHRCAAQTRLAACPHHPRHAVDAGFRAPVCARCAVLLGPLRALSYVLIHGVLAAALGAMWRQRANFWLCVLGGACVRMLGQLAYLVLSSVTMNENLFAIMMSNVYAMLVRAGLGFGWSACRLQLWAAQVLRGLCFRDLLTRAGPDMREHGHPRRAVAAGHQLHAVCAPAGQRLVLRVPPADHLPHHPPGAHTRIRAVLPRDRAM